MGDDHVPFFEEEVFDQGVFPLRSDPRFTDAEHVHEEELDGQAPARDKGGGGASGAVGLQSTDARSVDAFRNHVVPDT